MARFFLLSIAAALAIVSTAAPLQPSLSLSPEMATPVDENSPNVMFLAPEDFPTVTATYDGPVAMGSGSPDQLLTSVEPGSAEAAGTIPNGEAMLGLMPFSEQEGARYITVTVTSGAMATVTVTSAAMATVTVTATECAPGPTVTSI